MMDLRHTINGLNGITKNTVLAIKRFKNEVNRIKNSFGFGFQTPKWFKWSKNGKNFFTSFWDKKNG